MEWRGVEWSGVAWEWGGVEWSGAERSGAERSGVERRSGVEGAGGDCEAFLALYMGLRFPGQPEQER